MRNLRDRPVGQKITFRDHVDLGCGAASCVLPALFLLPSLYLEAAFRPRTGGGRLRITAHNCAAAVMFKDEGGRSANPYWTENDCPKSF